MRGSAGRRGADSQHGEARRGHSRADRPAASLPVTSQVAGCFCRFSHFWNATACGDQVGDNIKYAEAHRDVVQRWGRFPHRNGILGRPCTPEEASGLAEGSISRF